MWIAALLAAILPLEKLVTNDIELGFFDQLRLRGLTEEMMMAVRLVAHWLTFRQAHEIAAHTAKAVIAQSEPLRQGFEALGQVDIAATSE